MAILFNNLVKHLALLFFKGAFLLKLPCLQIKLINRKQGRSRYEEISVKGISIFLYLPLLKHFNYIIKVYTFMIF